MISEDEARAGLRALARDLSDRLGASFESVYERHLTVFTALRARRVPWSMIAKLCREEGVLDADGAGAAQVLASRVARATRRSGVPLAAVRSPVPTPFSSTNAVYNPVPLVPASVVDLSGDAILDSL